MTSTKLILSYMVGDWDSETANFFMDDVADRIDGRVQLTVSGAFGRDGVDYAMLVKLYGEPARAGPDKRFSPAECAGTKKVAVLGKPDKAHVSTSYVERQNLTKRIPCGVSRG